ncbi:MAG: F0F1 ATP synthase subunit gamma [Actinobacteria bacterium]|nr:F0F1 ATP synthase subunit gamma [Actinomycetota bacterium]
MASSGQLRQLRRRIKSVQSTQQITRAMEMIAASRIQKAIRRMQEALPYARMIHDIIRGLAASNEVQDHPLISPHDTIETVGILAISADRGLAGAYNSNVFRRVERLIRHERDQGHSVKLYLSGKKAISYFRFQGYDPAVTWSGYSERPEVEDALDIAERLMEDYREERIDRVWVVFTDFQSQMVQQPTEMEILPVDPEEFIEGEGAELPAEIMYEPGPEELLERLVPNFVEAVVYAAMLESAASEHAMRQRAMQSATENAEELADDLKRDLNQARQQQITQEISEIVGGAEALSES